MSNLVISQFEDKEIRVDMDSDGNPWFAAPDVCKALGISNPSDAIKDLDEDEKGVVSTDTPGGVQKINFLNVSGVNALILNSRKPEAKRLRKWLTSEVMPQLSKTGSYLEPTGAYAKIEKYKNNPRVAEHLLQTSKLIEYIELENEQKRLEEIQKAQDRELLRQAIALLEAQVKVKELEIDSQKKDQRIDDIEATHEYKIRDLSRKRYGPGKGYIPKGTLQLDDIRKKYFFGISESVISNYLTSVFHPMETYTYVDEHEGEHKTFCFKEEGLGIRYREFIKESEFLKETPKQFKFFHKSLITLDQKHYAFIKADFDYMEEEKRIFVRGLMAEKLITN